MQNTGVAHTHSALLPSLSLGLETWTVCHHYTAAVL